MTIDSHTHLTLLEDPDGAIERARDAGLRGMVTIGLGEDSIPHCLELARKHPGFIGVGVGVHPAKSAAFDRSLWPRYVVFAHQPGVCAIGETGFDMYRDNGSIELQHEMFVKHCELAREVQLPLVIHSRAADQHTLDALAEHAVGLTVIMHCFSMPDRVDEVVGRDYYVSFAGNVTYRTADDLRAAATKVPANRLLVETDAPYLAPVPQRGKKNEPAFVVNTLRVVAEARGESVHALGVATTDNALRIFPVLGAAAASRA